MRSSQRLPMRYALLLLCGLSGLLGAPFVCYAQASMETAFDLDDYRWKNRLLLVFAPSAKSPPYEQQLNLLSPTEAEQADRDLLMIHVLAEGESHIGDARLTPSDAAALRERFEVEDDAFLVVLVGKDGTEKRRDAAPVRPEAFFEQIDAMPMRQREMRERDG